MEKIHLKQHKLIDARMNLVHEAIAFYAKYCWLQVKCCHVTNYVLVISIILSPGVHPLRNA